MAAPAAFGAQLRRWRGVRRVSQLDLALAAKVSQRHISFLELGRSAPSRDMVLQLAGVLDLPLRDRNALLLAAGFAPAYPEHGLDDAELAQVKRVLDTLVRAHEPYPAYVVDRSWNLVLANDAASTLTSLVADAASAAAAAGGNVLRLLLHPHGLRPHIVNFPDVAAAILRRADLDARHAPDDERLTDLRDEAASLAGPGLSPHWPVEPAPDDLLVPLHLRFDDLELRLFTTVATIGAPHDVTLEELRLESLLPADVDSERALQALAGRQPK